MSDTMSAASMVGFELRRMAGLSSNCPFAESVIVTEDWPAMEPGNRMSRLAERSTLAASGSPLNWIDPRCSSNCRLSVSTDPRTKSMVPNRRLDSANDGLRASTCPRNSMSNGSPAFDRSHTFCWMSTERA